MSTAAGPSGACSASAGISIAGYLMSERGVLHYHSLERRQIVPVPLKRVFPFFESPENLALITPPSLGFRVLTPGPVVMQAGTIIDYSIRLGGMPVRWRSLISTYDPPVCFVDEQLKGPYAYWRHTHRFASSPPGTVLMDEVAYALPAGMPPLVEGMVHSLYVRPSLERIFDYRANFYAAFFGGRYDGVFLQPPATEVATETRS